MADKIALEKVYLTEYDDIGIHKHILYYKALQSEKILEIGTRSGNSTRIMAAAGKPHIWTIDVNPPVDDWNSKSNYPNITFITEDSLKVEWNRYIDMAFIDGCHQKEHVYKELVKYGKFVNPGGWILIHDTEHGEFGSGIKESIDKYCDERNLRVTYYKGSHGLGEINIPNG